MSAWPMVALGDVCEIVSGATPKSGTAEFWDGDILWATPKDLSNLNGDFISQPARNISKVGLRSCSAKLLPPHSVLFSSRAPIGLVAINTQPMATNQGFKSLIPKSNEVFSKYLFHWLRHNRSKLQALGNGATFKEVSKAIVGNIQFPLPPFDEQKRITAILDKADELRRKRRKALELLDTLTQSIFIEMFGSFEQTIKLGELFEFRYGTSKKSTGDGLPTLRIPNVISSTISLEDIKFVPHSNAEKERLALQENDCLFVRTNGNPDYVGRCALVTDALKKLSPTGNSSVSFASYLIRGRPKNKYVNSTFVQAYLSSKSGRKSLRAGAKTSAGQFNINTKALAGIEIPIFSSSLQERFATIVEVTKEKRKGIAVNLSIVETLFASLQSRAFSGEL